MENDDDLLDQAGMPVMLYPSLTTEQDTVLESGEPARRTSSNKQSNRTSVSPTPRASNVPDAGSAGRSDGPADHSSDVRRRSSGRRGSTGSKGKRSRGSRGSGKGKRRKHRRRASQSSLALQATENGVDDLGLDDAVDYEESFPESSNANVSNLAKRLDPDKYYVEETQMERNVKLDADGMPQYYDPHDNSMRCCCTACALIVLGVMAYLYFATDDSGVLLLIVAFLVIIAIGLAVIVHGTKSLSRPELSRSEALLVACCTPKDGEVVVA